MMHLDSIQRAAIALCVAAFFAFPLYLVSKPSGPEAELGRTGGPFPGEQTCGTALCHNVEPNIGPGGVFLSTNGAPLDQYRYTPGETIEVLIRVMDPSKARWGFQLAAREQADLCRDAGSFAPGDASMIRTSGEAIGSCPPGRNYALHNFAKVGAGEATFSVNWTAPPTNVGPLTFAAAGNAANGNNMNSGDSIYTTQAVVQVMQDGGPPPIISEGGLTDAAAFSVGPTTGSLASLFLQNGPDLAIAASVPLSTSLNGTTVAFQQVSALGEEGSKQQIAVAAPLLFVSPGQINLQIPWEVDVSSGTVRTTVTRNGVTSAPVDLPVRSASPGVFAFTGTLLGVAINAVDGSVSQPVGTFPPEFNIPHKPSQIGEFLIILATGLGAIDPNDPAPVTGAASLDSNGGFIQRDTATLPTVTIGGVPQNVLFSGLSPQFVGVNQINLEVVAGTPTGDAQPLVIEMATSDGIFRSREDVTVAIAP